MNNQLDERQLYLRVIVFRNGFFILLIYLLIDAFMKSNGVNLVEGMWGNILIVVSTSAYCMIDMLLREVADLEKQSNRVFYGIFGVLGLVLFVWGVAESVTKGHSMVTGRSLSEHGARLLMDLAWILVGVAYVYKLRGVRGGEEE
ncbi:MAG: hypothetical protein ACOX4K_06180 [Bacillota bacterium]|jgi:hypothetical protein